MATKTPYQIPPDDMLPARVRDPKQAKKLRDAAVKRARDRENRVGRVTASDRKFSLVKRIDLVCGDCGDDFLAKCDEYNPPAYRCYRCRKFVPVNKIR